MERIRLLLIVVFTLNTTASCLLGQLSNGIYRLPYQDGTDVRVSRDHLTHTPVNRLDMVGINGDAPYRIVAAQDGIVRFIADNNTTVCCGGACGNNYIWIEHANGEWTKYSHLATNSITVNAGLSVGDMVRIGTFLGFESNIGRACGVHLHFEVAVPSDPDNPLGPGNGGFINGSNRIPRFCNFGVLAAGNVYTSSSSNLFINSKNIPGGVYETTNNIYTTGGITTSSLVTFGAGNKIQITNFTVDANSHFIAEVNVNRCDLSSSFTNTSIDKRSDSPDKLVTSQILAYPTPFREMITLEFNLPEPLISDIEIFDLSGRLLQTLDRSDDQLTTDRLEIDLSDLPPGVYHIRLQTDQQAYIQKIVKIN